MSQQSRASLASGLIALTLSVAACRAMAPAGPAVSPEAVGALSTSATALRTPDAGCFHADESIAHVPYTIEVVTRASRLAFVGTVQSIEAGVWNTKDGAHPDTNRRPGPHFEPEILTPVNVNIDRPLVGDQTSGTLRVLNEGGTDGCSVVHVQPIPRLDRGGRYVFFLNHGHDLDGTPRPDLWVVITAWSVDASGNVSTEEDGAVRLSDLVSRVRKTAGS
jgi:hypothetical protein